MRYSKFISRSSLTVSLLALHLLSSIGHADWRSQRYIAPGVKHIFIQKESGPHQINILQSSLMDGRLSLATALANGYVMGNETLSTMVASAQTNHSQVVAAINGDFFRRPPDTYAGDPTGLHVLRGELISFPHHIRSALLITADGKLHIYRPRISAWAISSQGPRHTIHGLNQARDSGELVLYTTRFGDSTKTNPHGAEVILSTTRTDITTSCKIKGRITAISRSGNSKIPPKGMVLSGHGLSAWFLNQLTVGEEMEISIHLDPQPGEIVEAIGGGPRLLRDGKISVEAEEESFTPQFIHQRHPRTAIGFSRNSLFFVTVDGRQPKRSAGMTLYELARLMLSLGCQDALNLDGGGSTEMLVAGQMVNSPAGGEERPIANALLLLSGASPGVPTILTLRPAWTSILADDEVHLSVECQDSYYQACPLLPKQISWKVTPPVGEVSREGVFALTRPVQDSLNVEIEASTGRIRARAQVKVYPVPLSLRVVPEEIRLRPGQGQQFVVEGKTVDGGRIPSLLLKPTWSCSAGGGEMHPGGFFWAGQTPGKAKIFARLGDLLGQAEVTIDEEAALTK
ncbi:MAG: hypothetical protein GTO55_06845 [Armatimonadetes bacterium]|nr:hypothetical protein [Armatimonadota bacterium]NIM23995.1 hypothetical protein [Armatimonadota bacterium]NIM67845.1 hypothetical protein [Armatimonadota bacterium]NIM76376.1 hypothetical protein [Armatimonadota bacterium]NIN06075.1 hypothetical protein [Armatimonadota bacterium]